MTSSCSFHWQLALSCSRWSLTSQLGTSQEASAQIPPLSLRELAWSYVAASLTYSCLPSRADVEIVLSKPAGLIFYLGSAAILCWTRLKMFG